METIAGFMTVVWLIGFVVVIAWIILPFAMIGTKPLLRELIQQTKETNALLLAAQKLQADHSPAPPRAEQKLQPDISTSSGVSEGQFKTVEVKAPWGT